MPKYYKSKDRNPNDPNISISTQHTDRIGFSYSNILKSTKTLKEQRKTQQTPQNEKRCAEDAKI